VRTTKAQHANNVKIKKYGKTIQQSHQTQTPPELSQAENQGGQSPATGESSRCAGDSLTWIESFKSRSKGRLFCFGDDFGRAPGVSQRDTT
jgi:hypothetical protein